MATRRAPAAKLCHPFATSRADRSGRAANNRPVLSARIACPWRSRSASRRRRGRNHRCRAARTGGALQECRQCGKVGDIRRHEGFRWSAIAGIKDGMSGARRRHGGNRPSRPDQPGGIDRITKSQTEFARHRPEIARFVETRRGQQFTLDRCAVEGGPAHERHRFARCDTGARQDADKPDSFGVMDRPGRSGGGNLHRRRGQMTGANRRMSLSRRPGLRFSPWSSSATSCHTWATEGPLSFPCAKSR